MIHSTFIEGCIPVECTWQTVFHIPKGDEGILGIRVVEVIWKAVSRVVNLRIGVVVNFHDIMHRLSSGRGTGIASLEFKMLQKLTTMRYESLYHLF